MQDTKTEKKAVKFAKTIYSTKFDANGKRLMLCRNSEEGGRYWKGRLCRNWTYVGNDCSAVLCHKCTTRIVPSVEEKVNVPKSDKPRGWRFMKEYVDKDGSVYHKGVEVPELKGTLPVTVIIPKEPKKKLTASEKEAEIKRLGLEIKDLKAVLFSETRKGRRAAASKRLTQANKELTKLL
jgi:hypothetical protein